MIEQTARKDLTGTIFFSGGGTSGHIHPALAIATELRRQCPKLRIIFCGTSGGLEAKVVPQAGFDFIPVKAAPFPTRPSMRFFAACNEYRQGRKECTGLIKQYSPLAVIGTGGYVCAPMLGAAHKLKVPYLVHEQNAYPGRSNRLTAYHAAAVCLGFAAAERYFRTKGQIFVTGNPVRPEFFSLGTAVAKLGARRELELPLDRPIILISGGSLGARSLNLAALEWAKQQASVVTAEKAQTTTYKGPYIILATGSRRYEAAKRMVQDWPDMPFLRIEPYLNNMPTYMAAADLIIGRAGAVTCAELAAMGKPSVLIPYPYAAGDHQTYNAQALVHGGAALMYADKDWNASTMQEVLTDFVQNASAWDERSTAAESLANRPAAAEIVEIIFKTMLK